jgi:hypothetical protein
MKVLFFVIDHQDLQNYLCLLLYDHYFLSIFIQASLQRQIKGFLNLQIFSMLWKMKSHFFTCILRVINSRHSSAWINIEPTN